MPVAVLFVASSLAVMFAGGFRCSGVQPADLPVGPGPSAAGFPPGPGVQPVVERDPLQPAEAGAGAVAAEEDLSPVAGQGGHGGF